MSRLCSHAWQVWAKNNCSTSVSKFKVRAPQFQFCCLYLCSAPCSVRTLHRLSSFTCIKHVNVNQGQQFRTAPSHTHTNNFRPRIFCSTLVTQQREKINHGPSLNFVRTYARGKKTGAKTQRSNRNIFDMSDDVEQSPEREKDDKVSALFIPVDVPIKTSSDADEINVGEELGGSLRTKKARGKAKKLKMVKD